MNETITIKEGGLTRRLAPVDKLKVNTTDNKESMWVSTDETKTGVLHASENGIYIASEDGYEAYSEVIVRVTKDSFEGDTSFDDWDYETPDMDLSNWDPETIEDFELDPDGFDDVFNSEDEWKDIDKPIDIKMDNPKIQDTKISGIDPVTGNEMEVGLDEDGYLTESILPSSIKIEIPPDKLQYVDGQPILFRGMVVKGYTADGELWTDASHPDGVIPHSELTFPITTAINESKGWDGEYTDGNGLNLRRITFGDEKWGNFYLGPVIGVVKNMPGWGSERPLYIGASVPSVAYFTMYNNYLYFYGIDSAATFAAVAPDDDPFSTDYGYISSFSKNKWSKVNYSYHDGVQEWAPESTVDPTESSLDNLHPVGQTVPVQYIRSDGEVLDDSFTIEVLPDPDGMHPKRTDAIEYNGAYYQADPNLNAEAHYRSGTVWVQNRGAIYNTRDAVALGLLKPVED